MLEIDCPIHGSCEGFVTLFGMFCAKCLENLTEEEQEGKRNGSEDF